MASPRVEGSSTCTGPLPVLWGVWAFCLDLPKERNSHLSFWKLPGLALLKEHCPGPPLISQPAFSVNLPSSNKFKHHRIPKVTLPNQPSPTAPIWGRSLCSSLLDTEASINFMDSALTEQHQILVWPKKDTEVTEMVYGSPLSLGPITNKMVPLEVSLVIMWNLFVLTLSILFTLQLYWEFLGYLSTTQTSCRC